MLCHHCACWWPGTPRHRENSPVTQTTQEPTLLSCGGWPPKKIFPHPWPHGKPGLIALIGPLRPYCSTKKPFDLAQVCHGNKICSKLVLTWKLTLELASQHIAYRIKSWMEFLGPILAKLHKMPPTSAPRHLWCGTDSPLGQEVGENVQWSIKAWSGKTRRGDHPMC